MVLLHFIGMEYTLDNKKHAIPWDMDRAVNPPYLAPKLAFAFAQRNESNAWESVCNQLYIALDGFPFKIKKQTKFNRFEPIDSVN